MPESTEAMTPTTEAMTEGTTAMAQDIVAVASAAGSFKTLVAAVAAAGLVETLQSAGPFTVFAPTDDAFAALPAGLVDKLLLPANKDLLVKILTYHVVSGKVLAADVKSGDVASVEGSNITLTVADGKVMVNKATVTAADVMASNGVIHVIDQVILPPDVDISTL
ncbi:MAG: fasciclin domain-containing protein [Actinobacteria bacterium]|nr:fasciclin domain-containing protein [Actinomycetota bacterium]